MMGDRWVRQRPLGATGISVTVTIGAASITERRTDLVFKRLDDDLLALDLQARYCHTSMDRPLGPGS
jgi:hypothetical protein